MYKTRRRITRVIASCLFVGCTALGTTAQAIDQTGVTVTTVSSWFHGGVYTIGITPNPNGCVGSWVQISQPAEIKSWLSIALAAKLSGKTVWISADQTGGIGTDCIGNSIGIE